MATILKNNIKPGGSPLKGLVATDSSGNQRDVRFVRQVNASGAATTVYDTFDHYEYSDITITANHTYNGDVGANGSAVAVASAPQYKQTRWSVGASGAKYEETTLTTGATITYSGTHVAANGTVSGSSLGTTPVARNTSFASSVATVSMNGKSASTSGVAVAQAANAVTGTGNYNGFTQACYQSYTEYQVTGFASVGDIPAYGGKSYAQGTGQSRTNYKTSSYTKYEVHNQYTSGDHKHNGSYTTASGWTDGSAPSASAWGGNTTVKGSEVSGTSLGTTTTSSRTNKGNSTTTWNGVACSVAIYQAINAKSSSAATALNARTQACYQAYTEYQIINFASIGDIPASGGTSKGQGTGQSRTNYKGSSYTKYDYYYTWTAYAGDSNAKQYSYTSTASGWTDGSTPGAGSWGGNTTVTGSDVSGSHLHTTSTSRTKKGTSSVTWGGKTASADIYQAANGITKTTWNNPVVSAFGYATSSFGYGGGSSAAPNSKSASQSGTNTWTSGDTSATSNSSFTWSFSTSSTGFSVNSSTGVVTAGANNGAARNGVITAKATGSGGLSGTKTFTFSQATNPTNGYSYADLGLPSGLKWAKHDIGASSDSTSGDPYQWGQIVPCTSSNFIISTPSPFDVSDYILNSSQDAATQNWKGDWRMPTSQEINELCKNTTIQYTSNVGYKFISNKNSSNYSVFNFGKYYYWRELYTDDRLSYWSNSKKGGYIYALTGDSRPQGISGISYYYVGYRIRPVISI